jgi:CMP-N,N'-diacetyllegionaminic acid synthase
VINGLSVLAIVPARGGSKGIPLKNLREVGGRSLVARVGDVVALVPEIDRTVVSTDHQGIAQHAIMTGMSVLWRPGHLAGDAVGDIAVLMHALSGIEKIEGWYYDVVVMLQPTSPLRTPEQVSATIRKLVDEKWDAVWTVSETDSKTHPLKQLHVEGGLLDYYDDNGADIIARQQLKPVYHRNGIAYAMTRECIMDQRSVMGRKTGAIVTEGHHVSIDTEWDLQIAELALRTSSPQAILRQKDGKDNRASGPSLGTPVDRLRAERV